MRLSYADFLLYLIVVFMTILIVTIPVYGDGDEGGLFGEGASKQLGEVSWSFGLILNIFFVVLNRARKYFKLSLPFREILNIHITTNVFLGILGVLHGYSFLSKAGPVEYLAVFLIIFLLLSGLLLRFISGRDLKLLNRLVHTQLALALLLTLTIWVHIETIED